MRAAGVAYFSFAPLNVGVVAFALASIGVAERAAWKRDRVYRRKAFLVDAAASIVAGAVASFLTFELLVVSLSPLERNLVVTYQLFFWSASIPGGFTIAAQVLLLACAFRWGLANSRLRWPLLTSLVGGIGMPIVAYTWIYSGRETPLWPLGLTLVVVAAASDLMIHNRLGTPS